MRVVPTRHRVLALLLFVYLSSVAASCPKDAPIETQIATFGVIVADRIHDAQEALKVARAGGLAAETELTIREGLQVANQKGIELAPILRQIRETRSNVALHESTIARAKELAKGLSAGLRDALRLAGLNLPENVLKTITIVIEVAEDLLFDLGLEAAQ